MYLAENIEFTSRNIFQRRDFPGSYEFLDIEF